MESTTFLDNFTDKINNIRTKEFENYNFTYNDKIIEKKILNENSMEFKNFKNTIKKKALLDKSKPGNISKKEYESLNPGIDILEDDIFNNNSSENKSEDIKLDVESLDRDKKLELIYEFLQRKNIILEENELNKIIGIIDNPDVVLKKYLNISKIYQQVTKVSFIKKLENGSYIIDLNESKPKKSKNIFFK